MNVEPKVIDAKVVVAIDAKPTATAPKAMRGAVPIAEATSDLPESGFLGPEVAHEDVRGIP